MKKEEIDIFLAYPEHLPQGLEEELLEGLADLGVKFKKEKVEPGIMAALDWVVPGLFAAYILKPYFESFLSEAGKDHYQLLKKWIKSLVSKGKQLKVWRITARQSPKKVDSANSQSRAVTIHIQLKDDRTIKLLFDNNLELNDWMLAVDEIFERVLEHYQNYPSDTLSQKLSDLDQETRSEIYAIINPETKEWVFYDRQMVRNKLLPTKKAD